MKTHVFNKRRFRIHTTALDGFCDIPGDKGLDLFILADLDTKAGLITAIHEALHAEYPNIKEFTAEQVGKEIGSFLWRLGYRRGKK